MAKPNRTDDAGRFPAFCPECGYVFPSRLIAITPGVAVQNLWLSNNHDECPQCGAMAELPEGKFNVFGNTLEILEATPITRARLSQLAQILDRARRGEITDDVIADEIEKEDGWSGLADLIRTATPRARHALILLLIFVVQTIATHEIDEHVWGEGATNAEVKHDLSVVIDQLRDDHREVRTEVQQAIHQALIKYNAEHRPPRHHTDDDSSR